MLVARWFGLEIHQLRLNSHILAHGTIHKLLLTTKLGNANRVIDASLKLPGLHVLVYCIPEKFVGTGFTSEVLGLRQRRRKPVPAGVTALGYRVFDAIR
jgi:hypothetical protein